MQARLPSRLIGRYALITHDLFDVSRRIREIDEGYFIVYSFKRKRYEVHHSEQRGDTLCLVVPYPVLDERTLTHVRRSARERAAQYLADVERENARAEKAERAAVIKRAERELESKFASM